MVQMMPPLKPLLAKTVSTANLPWPI
ncbi:hypothetical protein NC652_025087 [Populus alba x Populus x berolinensis]|uniref:Uncharacterized protein n=1 Tax=Populus alba x Populus x berolinensis TaxID=444605 RepID=A0AAD6M830_9ROSI|nr:hypothetical protein NC652_025087 [Populus alba x Populus x berolinensis]KAJ6980650.1 hypothetical protein NC653_024096 [Populus alba x Populus x berolinensis]